MRQDAQSKRNAMFRPLTGLFVSSVIIAILFFIPSVGFGYSFSIDPASDTGDVGGEHTVTVTVAPTPVKYTAEFTIVSGPHADPSVVNSCDSVDGDIHAVCLNDSASFSYTGQNPGTDTIHVRVVVYEEMMPGRYLEAESYEGDASKDWLEPVPEELSVDVNMGRNPVIIHLRKQMRVIPKKRWKKYTSVLRLMVNGSSDFNAADAAEFPFSLCGPDGDVSVAPKRVRLKDKDRDGNMDLILAFHVPDLISRGLLHADCTGLLLRGQTADGTAIKANLPVEVVGSKCRKPWKKKYKKDRWKKKKVFEYAGKNGKKTKVVVKYRGKNCKKHKVVVIKRSNKNGLKKVTVKKYGKNGLMKKVMWKRNR